ncbi:hypothetical protein CIG75_17530 [Tumebacillus algifaecis]|uniref:DNA-directed RNA polymerase subunit P n=1 Tax=Tumebacillus algifaecis TaxID=1214604 RepID=A0A223D592_9BACL|nr:hypothetical protein [Tumebacillus algifaecis]ASS76586.1 hypothetical protein CIG75_17530 [Tumebacillus algifaecis]
MDILSYKCPNCSGTLKFDSQIGQMLCEYCDSTFDPEVLKKYDEVLQEEASKDPDWDTYESDEWQDPNLGVHLCNSCGAEIVAEETTAATFCPYCDSATILSGRLSGALKPDLVIPFKIEKEQAKAELKKFCSGKRLLPSLFLANNRIEKITGVYVPFWLFDCEAEANITYDAKKVRTWKQGNYRYTETSHFLIHRAGKIGFERIPVDGSEKMDDAYMEALEPYNYEEAVDFATAYLSGYLADKYDVDAESSKPRANQRIKDSTEKKFAETVSGYAVVTPRSTAIDLTDGKIRYALLPVWMLNTKFGGKTYTFAMNGQTGKFIGELPISKGKYWGYVAGITAVLSTVGLLTVFL